jgi:DNA uptake protein ComE-like DNA-binding protein
MRIPERLAVAGLLLFAAGVFGQSGNNEAILDANLAERGELMSVSGIDDALAAAIVAGRPYTTASGFDAVLSASLDESQREAVYGSVFRQINLNTASRDEIMLIPGMSERMAHEFEEYRPYTSLEQFRREIGKYVDADEVARLEQYVFIPMNLNDAPLEHFETIPGMTPKMVHEFEEYRPYTSMEQFRREIGKYVDGDEVARLESYVTLD